MSRDLLKEMEDLGIEGCPLVRVHVGNINNPAYFDGTTVRSNEIEEALDCPLDHIPTLDLTKRSIKEISKARMERNV